MGYRVRAHGHPAGEIARIVQEQTARAQEAMETLSLLPAERARKARIACKRIRAALGLMGTGSLNTGKKPDHLFRDAARALSAVRDDGALQSTLERLRDEAAGQVGKRALYVAHRVLGSDSASGKSKLSNPATAATAFGRALAAGNSRVQKIFARRNRGGACFDWAEDGFRAGYAQARRCFWHAQGHPTDPALHTWRKRVKTHTFQCALLSKTWPKMMQPWRESLKRLGALLGYERDLGLLRKCLCARLAAQEESEHNVRSLLRWIDARRDALRAEAFALGEYIYTEKPRVVTRRVAGWWQAAQRAS